MDNASECSTSNIKSFYDDCVDYLFSSKQTPLSKLTSEQIEEEILKVM